MYRLILADDEPWIAYRLSHLVDYGALGFELVQTAADGQAAFTLCTELRADALLTDIRMPGMDGLELLAALRQSGQSTEVVLISGYAEFSYAQAAVREGAYDYLIKQVSPQQLEDVLRRLKTHLDGCRAQDRALENIDALFSLFNDERMTLAQWLERHFHPIAERRMRFGCFSRVPPGALLSLPCGHSTYCAPLPCAPDGSLPEHTTPAGYSDAATQDAPAAELFRQSSMAYLTSIFHGGSKPVLYRAGTSQDVTGLMRDLDAALLEGHYGKCRALLAALCERTQQMGIDRIAALYNRLCRLFDSRIPAVRLSGEDIDYRQLVRMFASPQEMFALFESSLCSAAADEGQFDPVLRYIDANLAKELRISELADRFHFSPSYFSTLFHKHVGTTFTKYLTRKRMEHAAQLMADKRLTLSEIAEQCGYADYFHFNKTFKRFYAVSPGQYRKNSGAAGGAI